MFVNRQEGVTALHTAVQAGHEPVVRALLAGADRTAAVRVDAPRHDGVTPLALAAQTGAAPVRDHHVSPTPSSPHPHGDLTVVSPVTVSIDVVSLRTHAPSRFRLSSSEASLVGWVSYPALGVPRRAS